MSAADEPLRESAVFNLTGAVTMVVDDSPFSMEVTIQALQGFGIRTKHTPRSTAQAMELLKLHPVDLLFVDCEMEGSDGHGLVRWLRRSGLEPNAFVPVIMTASHVRRSKVADVRDCGANFLVTKPFSPAVVLERIIWVARDNRAFLEAGDFSGPDRRFAPATPRNDGERRADMIRLISHLADSAAAASAEALSS